MFYVDIGLLEGANATFSEFLYKNLLPVTLGNFIGGGVFLGLAQYATFEDSARSAQARPNADLPPLHDHRDYGSKSREDDVLLRRTTIQE